MQAEIEKKNAVFNFVFYEPQPTPPPGIGARIKYDTKDASKQYATIKEHEEWVSVFGWSPMDFALDIPATAAEPGITPFNLDS
jgi:hypothetical protein